MLDVAMEMEGSASVSAPAEDARLVRTGVGEADLRRCNRCAEPFVTKTGSWARLLRREWSPVRQHTNKSLMDLHVHDLPATPLHGLPCQGDWQSTSYESDWTDRDVTQSSTCTS